MNLLHSFFGIVIIITFPLVAFSATIELLQEDFKITQKFDELYEKGISTYGCYETVTPPIFGGEVQITDREWSYTHSKRLRAVLEVTKIKPKLNKDGIVVFHREIMLFDHRRSGMKQIRLDDSVDIQDYNVSSAVHSAVLDVQASDSSTMKLMVDKFSFALGRGICRNIITLTDTDLPKQINHNGELCLVFSGHGNYLTGKNAGIGIWEVYVLPDAAYMVRHAKFSCDSEVLLEVNTYGLQSDGECVFPKKSEIKFFPEDVNIIHTFHFTSAKFEFDSVLFEQVQKDFDAEMPDGSMKIDSSSGKDTIQVVGGEEPVTFDEPERFINWYRILFVIVINVIGIALIIYLYLRNRRKK